MMLQTVQQKQMDPCQFLIIEDWELNVTKDDEIKIDGMCVLLYNHYLAVLRKQKIPQVIVLPNILFEFENDIQSFILEYLHVNKQPYEFMDWIENSIMMCKKTFLRHN